METQEFRIQRLEVQKEDTENELKELTYTIQTLENLMETTKSKDTKKVIDRNISQLQEHQEFLEGSIAEIEGSIDFVRSVL